MSNLFTKAHVKNFLQLTNLGHKKNTFLCHFYLTFLSGDNCKDSGGRQSPSYQLYYDPVCGRGLSSGCTILVDV